MMDGSPSVIQVEVSSLCNLNCFMCQRRTWNPSEEGVMGFSLFKRLRDAVREADKVVLYGLGEPLMNPDIVKMADTTVVVLVPGLGDSIQTIKAGIMEIADIFVVNKADQENADKTVLELEDTLDLKHKEKDSSEWKKPVLKTIATTGEGIPELIKKIEEHKEYLVKSNILEKHRLKRIEEEILDLVLTKIQTHILRSLVQTDEFKVLVQETAKGETDPLSAADRILKKLLQKF